MVGGGKGRECYVSTNVISFCFYTSTCACTHAHAYVEVSQLNKFANSFGPSCPRPR